MNDWITIPEEFIEDKPLPEGYFWKLKEDDNQFASIRLGEDTVPDMARRKASIKRHGIILLVAARAGNDWEDLGTFSDTEEGLEQAVNFMYAHFILGEQST